MAHSVSSSSSSSPGSASCSSTMRSCTRLVGDHPPVVGLVPVSCRVHPNPNDLWRDFPVIMRALEPEVMDVIWQAVEPLLPATSRSHPLGCHRPRVPDRLCFRGIMIRLVTGASWVDVEAILDHQVSDTTLRARRDEWIHAGVFEQLKAEALAAFDRIVGLDLDDVALDGSLHKAPYGGEGTGAI